MSTVGSPAHAALRFTHPDRHGKFLARQVTLQHLINGCSDGERTSEMDLPAIRRECTSRPTDITVRHFDSESGHSCHSKLLCAASDFFCKLINSPLEEGKSEFTISGFSENVLESILRWIYEPDAVLISSQNALELFCAAAYFAIPLLSRTVAHYLLNSTDPADLYVVYQCMREHQSHELAEEFYHRLLEQAEEVFGTNGHLTWDFATFWEIVLSNELAVEKEELVWSAVVSWFQHDPSSRRESMGSLLDCVRFPLIEELPADIDKLMTEIDCEGIRSQMERLLSERERLRLDSTRAYELSHARYRLRDIGFENGIVLAYGRSKVPIDGFTNMDFERSPLNQMLFLNPLTGRMRRMRSLPIVHDRSLISCAVHRSESGELLVVACYQTEGGCAPTTFWLFRYDCLEDEWRPQCIVLEACHSLSLERVSASKDTLVVLYRKYTEQHYTLQCRTLSTGLLRWTTTITKRSLGPLFHVGKEVLFVCCQTEDIGHDRVGEWDVNFRETHLLDIDTQVWQRKSDCLWSSPFSTGPACITPAGIIFVLGSTGQERRDRTNMDHVVLQTYDTATDVWTALYRVRRDQHPELESLCWFEGKLLGFTEEWRYRAPSEHRRVVPRKEDIYLFPRRCHRELEVFEYDGATAAWKKVDMSTPLAIRDSRFPAERYCTPFTIRRSALRGDPITYRDVPEPPPRAAATS